MWGHPFDCGCPVCRGLYRVFQLISIGSPAPGFGEFAGQAVRGLEGELRDDLARRGIISGAINPGVAATAPVFSPGPVPFFTGGGTSQVIIGPPPPGPPPKRGDLYSQPQPQRGDLSQPPQPKGEGTSQALPKKGVGNSQEGPRLLTGKDPLQLGAKSAGPRPPGDFSQEEGKTSGQVPVKEEPSGSPKEEKGPVADVSVDEEETPKKAADQDRSRSRKRKRTRSEKQARKEEKERKRRTEESRKERKSREEEVPEKGVESAPKEEEEIRSTEPASGSGLKREPRTPSRSPPRRGGGREKKHRDEEELPRREPARGRGQGPGWIGRIPWSGHQRWRGKNKGIVKRAKQERYNERYHR